MTIVALFLLAISAFGQQKQFSSVTIAPSDPGKRFMPHVHTIRTTSASIDRMDATLWDLITEAYPNRTWSRIVVPKTLEAAITAPGNYMPPRFNLHASIPAGSKSTDIPIMMQAMLQQKFGLKAHDDMLPVPVYELRTIPPNKNLPFDDPKFSKAVAAVAVKHTKIGIGKNHTYEMSCTFPQLAAFLQDNTKFDVIDRTGLSGIYHFSIPMIAADGYEPGDHSRFSGPPGLNGHLTRNMRYWQMGLLRIGIDMSTTQTMMPITVIDNIQAQPK